MTTFLQVDEPGHPSHHAVILANDTRLTDFFLEQCPSSPGVRFHVFGDTRNFNLLEELRGAFLRRPDLDVLFHDGQHAIRTVAPLLGFGDLDFSFPPAKSVHPSIGDIVVYRDRQYFVELVDEDSARIRNGKDVRHIQTAKLTAPQPPIVVSAANFYANFVLTLKLVPLLYLKHVFNIDKILYMDDDCVVLGDLRPLIDKYKYAMHGDRFLTIRPGYLSVFNSVCQCSLTEAEYNTGRMCAGVTILTYTDRLLQNIRSFFEHPYLQTLWAESVTNTSKYNKAFFLEQFLYNFHFKSGCEYSRFQNDEVRVGDGSIFTAKRVHPATVYHYGLGKQKFDWIARFRSLR